MERVHLIVYSDYLCPWCYNGTVRLHRIEEEFGDAVQLEWRSFLLRPQPEPRTMERFRAYTQSWLRPAADEDAGEFRVWEGDAGPPTHSVPPHLVAKAAAALGDAAFRDMHLRLLHAYFAENRDITDAATLAAIWREAGFPAAELARANDPELLRRTIDEHNEAIEAGVSGVPSVCVAGRSGAVIGAQPLELYRRWLRRLLAEE